MNTHTSSVNEPELDLSEVEGLFSKLKAEVDERFPPTTYVYNPNIEQFPDWQMVIAGLRSRPNTTVIASQYAPMEKIISYPTPQPLSSKPRFG